MADTPEKTSNEPRDYATWEVDGPNWKYLGIQRATSNQAARKAAASEGEADGKPRTGAFYAASLSGVQGEAFVKEMEPVVKTTPLSLIDPPVEEPVEGPPPPAKTNGRSRRKPAPVEEPVA